MALFNIFKRSTLKDEFIKLLQENRHRIPESGVIKNVAILASEEITDTTNLQSYLESCFDFSTTQIYIYRKYDKNNIPSTRHFSEDVINSNGEILDPAFKSFLHHPFDLLVTYFNNENLFLEYATLYSRAKYKVGFAQVNSDLFDLEVTTDVKNIEAYNQEIKKYLLILNKLDCKNNSLGV